MKKVNITNNSKLLLLGAMALLFSPTQASAQIQIHETVNSGTYASAIGYYTQAIGNNAFSSGYYTLASGNWSTAFGKNSVSSGLASLAFGDKCQATGDKSSAIGYEAVTNADETMAFGSFVQANAFQSMTFGTGRYGDPIQNNISQSLMIGFNSNLPSFFIGPSAGAGTTGRIGIGTTNTPTIIGGQNIDSYRLFVAGGILTDEIRVRTGWADYVFADDYQLPTLTEVGAYIDENGHLPNVPSAEQVEAEGIDIGEMTRIQQEKIEELTLYMIEMQKEIELLKAKLQTLED